MNALPRKDRLSKDDVVQSIAQVCRSYTAINYQVEGSHTNKSLDHLKARAVSLASEISIRQQELSHIELRSQRRATALCWLGSGIAIG